MRLFTRYYCFSTKKSYPIWHIRKPYWNYMVEKGLISQWVDKLFYTYILGERYFDYSTNEPIPRDKIKGRIVTREYNWLGRFLVWLYTDKVRHWQKRSKNETLPTNLSRCYAQNNSPS